jgi:hypothetical protein
MEIFCRVLYTISRQGTSVAVTFTAVLVLVFVSIGSLPTDSFPVRRFLHRS